MLITGEENQAIEEKPVLVSNRPKKIRNGLAWDRIWASTVAGQEANKQATRVSRQSRACSDYLSESGVCAEFPLAQC